MLYKEDWDLAKQRIEAYWHKENKGRCLLQVKAVKDRKIGNPKRYNIDRDGNLEEFWLSPERVVQRYVEYFENTYFAAEAVPFFDVNLGPGITAAYLGSPVKLYERTVWFDSIIEDLERFDVSFDENNFWWQKTKEITAFAAAKGKDKFLTGVTDLSGVSDIIAHLRGSESLCMDLLLYPDKIKLLRDEILSIWIKCKKELYEITQECQNGSIDWMGIWAPDMHHSLQCDFSAVISPKMFEEFFVPEIQVQCREMPYSMYHLDGPDAVKHVDLLLDIPELDAVQWQPGDGQPRAVEWIPLLKKIQSAGKCIYIDALPQDVDKILKEISPKGLCINILDTFEDCDSANNFINHVESLCRGQQKGYIF